MGLYLVENIAPQGFINKVKFIFEDAGYDRLKNYEIAKKYETQTIIPLNLRNEKELTARLSSNGTPRCSMSYNMVCWGDGGNYLKFCCPHTLGKVNYPYGSTLWCSSLGYGMVIKLTQKIICTIFLFLHRYTRNGIHFTRNMQV